MLAQVNQLIAQIVLKEDFEDLPKERVKAGVKGFSFNLGADAFDRSPIRKRLDQKDFSESFSLFFWVKAAPDDVDYEVITLSFGQKDSIDLKWSIGKQANGAWYWESRDEKDKVAYLYRPTVGRQSIANSEWNMIGVSYDAQHQDIWFYYNGANVAIYHLDVSPLVEQNASLWIGGSPRGELKSWDTFNGSIDELEVHSSFLLSRDIKDRYQKYSTKNIKNKVEKPVSELKVMSFNIWHGGNQTGKSVGPQRVADLIRDSGADIIAVQETYGSGEQIADALGYFFYLRSTNLSIMSRYPIQETLPAYRPFNSGAVRIEYSEGRKVTFATNWLTYPIDYWKELENNNNIDSIEWYNKQVAVNKAPLKKILEVLQPSLELTDSIPILFCGDLNSGSHLDWTAETKHLNNGYIMPFPSSVFMIEKGFKDSYREVFPDPLQYRGITWSPTFLNAFKDRIDYIYYKGKGVTVKDARTIDSAPYRFPSDHAAVVATFEIH